MATRMHAGERREQLLDATKTIVVEHGFHAVSIEAVAREAGITRPIVYGHFDDLAGLLEALVERETAARAGAARASLPTRGRPATTCWRRCARYLEAVRSDPDTWRLVLMPQEGAPRLLHDRIARGRAAVVAQLAARGRPAALELARPRAVRAHAVGVRRRGRAAAARPTPSATRPSGSSTSRAG